jgi:hypothetical protein
VKEPLRLFPPGLIIPDVPLASRATITDEHMQRIASIVRRLDLEASPFWRAVLERQIGFPQDLAGIFDWNSLRVDEPQPILVDPGQEAEHVVDAILGHRMVEGVRLYNVKFSDRDVRDLPLETLVDDDLRMTAALVAYLNHHPQLKRIGTAQLAIVARSVSVSGTRAAACYRRPPRRD